jgi:hypothetical protein
MMLLNLSGGNDNKISRLFDSEQTNPCICLQHFYWLVVSLRDGIISTVCIELISKGFGRGHIGGERFRLVKGGIEI